MAARSLTNFLDKIRDDTKIIESMGEGFGEAEEKARVRHDEIRDALMI